MRLLNVLCPALLAASASPARAGGYMLPDSGIMANGRGNAVVAGGEGQFMQYYNPAALMRSDRPELNVGLSGVAQSVSFTRTAEDGTQLQPAVNANPPFPVPQLGLVTPLVKDKVALAFGFYSPFAPSYDYERTGEQRYSVVDTLIWKFSIGPSIAVRPIPQLSVGLGLQWNVLRVDESLVVSTSGLDDPAGDVYVEARVLDMFTPGFNAGILIEPVKQLSIGLAVEPPIRFDARGRAEMDFSGHGLEDSLDSVNLVDEDIGLAISLPVVLRAGVAVRPVEILELEADIQFEQWKVLSDLVVSDIDVTVTSESLGLAEEVDDTLSLPAGFDSTMSYRFGAELDAMEELSLRVGGMYETGALAPEELSVALVDTPKFKLGGGATVRIGEHLSLDGSFAHLFYRDYTISESVVEQVNVYDSDKGGATVGNGTMETDAWLAGLQARVAFGKRS